MGQVLLVALALVTATDLIHTHLYSLSEQELLMFPYKADVKLSGSRLGIS